MPELPAVIALSGPVAAPEALTVARRKASGSETRARPHVMFVRLTDSERSEIEAAARAAGMEVGSYARHMALTEPDQRGTEAHVTTRPTRLPFRVTEAERAEIEAQADRAGLMPGSYIRARALKRPVTLTTRRPPANMKELTRALGMLGAVRSSINQLTFERNRSDHVPLVDVTDTLADVRRAAVAIIESLGRKAE